MASKIPLAGVIGSPISHSLSPRLHTTWLRKLGLPGHYIPMDITASDLPDALRAMPKMGFVGANVTIPHKEIVLNLADIVTDRAAMIGAANTIIFRADGKIHADNTDGYGFLENLKRGAPDWQPREKPAAILGAGGASRAVVTALIDAGVPEIMISNRTRSRAEKLANDLGHRVTVVDWVKSGNMIANAGVIVNTTSLGMTNQPELRVPLDGLRSGMVVNDLVYNPLETAFLASARAAGCTVVDGLGMLLHQAVPGFERWFGMRPTVDDDIREAMLR